MCAEVVNIRQEKDYIYIGRSKGGIIPSPPENGCYGNPFSVQEHGRDVSIEKFKKYFLDRIEEDEDFLQAVLKLKDKRLGCFCSPLACHGDVYKEWLEGEF